MSFYEYTLIGCALYCFFSALTVNTSNMASALYFKVLPFFVGLVILAGVFKPF
jgi:ABC-type uncharacterized transport system permease subunit